MGTWHIKQPIELSYIHCPRTGLGMKAITREWLHPQFTVEENTEWMIDHPSLKMVRERIPNGKTMTVVRNPWKRVWSLYNKISSEGYWLDWNNQSVMDIKPFNEWLIDYANPEVVFEWPRWFTRFTNMVEFINYEDRWVDFILLAETLEKDFKQVQDYLNCYTPLPELSMYKETNDYKRDYTSAGIEAVYTVYKQDIDKFNYSF
jgi:hypothetical protein